MLSSDSAKRTSDGLYGEIFISFCTVLDEQKEQFHEYITLTCCHNEENRSYRYT